MDITDLPAHAIAQALRQRQFSCRELMQATLDRIATVNPVHNALVALRDGDALLREADDRDLQLQRGAPLGWMHGLPQAIKDMANTAGIRSTQGSPLLRDCVPTEDSLMVQRMKAAGCIVIGKSNTPEFGLGSHTFNTVYGLTRNAYDPSKSAGGSSGGAAVALATRMLSVADGSDFMGSLRNPAAWNNVFGLRPSAGRVPAWPAADVWISPLGTEGSMGRNVRDVALLLEVQAGHDPRVPLSLPSGERFADALDLPLPSGLRLGWLGDLDGHLAMEPGILEVCAQGLNRLQTVGCEIEAVQPTFDPPAVWQAWLVWRRWLTAARIAPWLADPANRQHIKPEALWEVDQAQSLTAAQALQASQVRSSFLQQMLAMFQHADVLALPCTQVWPFDAAQRWPTQIAGRAMDTYHRWMESVIYATFAGLPCISVPVGFNATGLPMGMQLIGKPQGERALLQLAHAYEQAAQDVLNVRP